MARDTQSRSSTTGSVEDYRTRLRASSTPTGDLPFRPGTRVVVQGGKLTTYDGPGLVSRSGQVLLRNNQPFYYDPNEAYDVYAVSPEQRRVMLEKLVRAGFLSESAVGNFNSEINAIAEWLDYSNTIGLERNYALDQKISTTPLRSAKGATGGQTYVYRTTSPQDLTMIAKRVSQDVLGREISDAEAAQFASMYQQQEIGYQKAAYAGGVITEPMTMETAARNFAQNIAPDEAAAYTYLGYMNKFFDMIGVQ